MDFLASLDQSITIEPGEQALIPLGVKVAVPVGYKLTLKPRSGLAAKRMITVTNSPGTIDADYRGEVKAILLNLGREPFVVENGMAIIQGEVEAAPQHHMEEVGTEQELGETSRGEGGLGHTGLKKV